MIGRAAAYRASGLTRVFLRPTLLLGTALWGIAPIHAAIVVAPPPAFAVCAACHATEPGKTRIGPSLAGIAGRKAGSLDGFVYSPALRASNLVWDAASLDRFITSPAAAVPGTRMAFAGVKDASRRSEIVDYLLTLNH
ncbi:c-type cytochrome [Glacieibacterium megasporae]|uniref:c-type cytochrome n=1 Tax=Glacieibacterium megasporae TaxID=2835787 RepID=UPI001CAA6070|nr:c-type cytochrome [Polymorphobacter megasporae]UAJ12454.1 c-type cytochrome [Polymorphobacter megasporae]